MTILDYVIIVAWFSASLWLAMMLLAFLLHFTRRHPHGTGAHLGPRN